MDMMYKITAGVMALYGLISLSGGALGFINKGSMPSLLAGGACGILLLLSAGAVFYRPTWGFIMGIVVSAYLMYNLPGITWLRLIVWLALGMIVYFAYGRSHSRVQRREVAS